MEHNGFPRSFEVLPVTSNSVTEKYHSTLADAHTVREYTDKIIETIHEPFLVLDPELRVQLVNPAFYTTFQVEPEASLGRYIYELGNGQWDIPALRVLLEDVLPHDKVFHDYAVTHTFEHLGERTMLLNARRLDHIQFILLAIEDITERQRFNESLEAQVQERTAALQQSEAQVRMLAAQLTLAEQAERNRIAQLLHDDLQQRLYGLQMHMTFIRKDVDSGAQPQLAADAQQVYAMVGDAIAITRQLSIDLSPPVLQDEGLENALRWLVVQMAEVHGLRVTLRAEHAFRISDKDMRVLLFQIVRELLFNVRKHAATDEATVELRSDNTGQLFIQINDAGQGFDVAAAAAAHTGGFGLFSVRERLNLFGGHMAIDSAPGHGTRITLTVAVSFTQGATAPLTEI